MADPKCWRCRRKLFVARIRAGVVVPEGIEIEFPCARCKAINAVALDSLEPRAVACA
jgi:hypothetical protein